MKRRRPMTAADYLAQQESNPGQGMDDDLLAYTGFPPGHWSKIWSNNPIERLNRELKSRTDVVQISSRRCPLLASPSEGWHGPPS